MARRAPVRQVADDVVRPVDVPVAPGRQLAAVAPAAPPTAEVRRTVTTITFTYERDQRGVRFTCERREEALVYTAAGRPLARQGDRQ